MEKISLTVSQVPALMDVWDYELNQKINPNNLRVQSNVEVYWKCEHGHSWKEKVKNVYRRKNKCPFCSGNIIVSGINDLESLFPSIAAEWDYGANGDVLPSQVSPNSQKAYGWICPKGHRYRRNVYLRTHSKRPIDCPMCLNARSTSFPEQTLYYYTKQLFPDSINRYKIPSNKKLELDIFIPSQRVGIEYDGVYFHDSQESREREKRKYQLCKKEHIKLIRVSELETNLDTYINADEFFHINKRAKDKEVDNFLFNFFLVLTKWSHPHYKVINNHVTNKRQLFYGLPIDINIKRDRPKILEYLINIERSFGKLFPELAKNWHDTANGKLTPFMFSPGSNHKVYFKCERCGETWSTSISSVVKWNRVLCKKCSMGDNGKNWTKRAVKNNGSLGEKHPEMIEEWDDEANGDLSPFDIPVSYSKKVHWKCKVCGYKWKQSPNARIQKEQKHSCPHCSGRVPMPGVDDLGTLYPEIASEFDYTKNKGITPSELLSHSARRIHWICSKHKISFISSPANRVKGCGCRLCKGNKIIEIKGFKVEQYDKQRKLINTYNSLNEAARVLECSTESIRQAVLKGSFSHGFYWKYEGQEFVTLRPDKKMAVVGTNIKTGEEIEFESASAAERALSTDHSKILYCCKKKKGYKTAAGYYWRFKDEIN